jgi:hypothetical protein
MRCQIHGWHLCEQDSDTLRHVHRSYAVTDPWDDVIWTWARARVVPFSASDVLSEALSKPKGQWEDRDLKRVIRSLRRGGWMPDANKVKGQPRNWLLAQEKSPSSPSSPQ